VAADGNGNIYTSTSGYGPGSWNAIKVSGANGSVSEMSCPTRSFCIGTQGNNGLLSSDDPSNPSATWTYNAWPSVVTGISCASASLCVAVDVDGDVWSSSNPGEGPAAWSKTAVQGSPFFTAISCASGGLCVATAKGGLAAVSSSPGGGASSWSVLTVDTSPGLGSDGMNPANLINSIACPSVNLCVGADFGNNLVVSSAPTTAGSWQLVHENGAFPESGLGGVTCASSSCFVTQGQGFVISSKNPGGGAAAWHTDSVSASAAFRIGCTNTSCVAIDLSGGIFVGTL
jgi:hypothetical protein